MSLKPSPAPGPAPAAHRQGTFPFSASAVAPISRPPRLSERQAFSERRRSSILVGQRSLDLLMDQQPGHQGPRFVIFIIRQYRRWGYFIADHDWIAILLCLVISCFGLYMVLTTQQQNDITGYSPYGARAREEHKRYLEFFSEDGPGVTVYIFALAKDRGSMIREEHLNETVHVLKHASEDIKLFDPSTNEELSFNQFCHSFCSTNEPVLQFFNGLNIQSKDAKKGEKPSGKIELNYPTTIILGNSVSLLQSFFGIEKFEEVKPDESFNVTHAILTADSGNFSQILEDGAGNLTASNSTDLSLSAEELPRLTNMKEVKMLVLQFRAEHRPGWTSQIVKKYEMDMVQMFQKEYKSEFIDLYVLSQSYVEEEMVRAGISMLPYLTFGFGVMAVCAVFSVVIRAIYMHQHSMPKILLAIAACVLPFMSCATALGLMFYFGMRFASILCVIPFLVLSIGVDSSYLMIHEWQRVIKHCREQPNRKNANVGYRISQVLSEVGPAILISTLTNIFADGMGTFTSSPEITLLCLGNLISMMVAFFYQMTFYAGLMSLVGRFEISQERKERRQLQESLRRSTIKSLDINGKSPLTRQESKFIENSKHYISETMLVYVNFVASKAIALVTIALYFLYLGLSIWGITRMNINLSTQKLFAMDSPLLTLDKLRVEYQVPHFTQATVFVYNPGNLSDPARLKRMNSFVADLERIEESWGPDGTQYFVRDFLVHEGTETEGFGEPSDSEDVKPALVPTTTITPSGPFRESDLQGFVDWPEFTHWSGYLKIDNKTGGPKLRRFFFQTAYKGTHLSIWTERGKLLQKWRKIVDEYTAEFNASVFHEDGVFLDLIDNMPTDTWQSVLGTLVAMALICFVFLNSLFTVVMASSCVLSIVCGILGILSWMNVDLDPITMAAMIISIGFSVDIPAHVSYHYYQASVREFNASPQIKLVNCLSSVAFPALQAALSTTLCVCSLLFVDLYMAKVFVKTMVLCVVLCNLHGLVFLPAFLIAFDDTVQFFRRLSRRRRRIANNTMARSRNDGSKAPPEGRISEEGSIQQDSIKKEKENSGEKRRQYQHHNALNGNESRAASRVPMPKSSTTDRPSLSKHFESIDLDDPPAKLPATNSDRPELTLNTMQTLDPRDAGDYSNMVTVATPTLPNGPEFPDEKDSEANRTQNTSR